MNILLIILIAYFVYSYLFALIYLVKIKAVRGIGYNFVMLLFLIPFTIFTVITMPFIGIMWFIKATNRIKMDTFTILHKLTEENKIALRQLWFDEGTFVSDANFAYDGFRKKIGTTKIYISNDGYVCIWGDLTKEVKFYKERIKALRETQEKEN